MEDLIFEKRKKRGEKQNLFILQVSVCCPQWPFLLREEQPSQSPSGIQMQDHWLLRPQGAGAHPVFLALTTSWHIFSIHLAAALGLFPGISGERGDWRSRASCHSQVPFQGREPSPAVAHTGTKGTVHRGTG